MASATHAPRPTSRTCCLHEKVYEEGDNSLAVLTVDSIWDPLGSDSRFEELLRRMIFPP